MDQILGLYFSSPVLYWDAILKMTEIELELISDYDVYLFVEKSMKGGTSYIAEKINKADNKNMRSYVNSKPRKHIAYLDGSNSYF